MLSLLPGQINVQGLHLGNLWHTQRLKHFITDILPRDLQNSLHGLVIKLTPHLCNSCNAGFAVFTLWPCAYLPVCAIRNHRLQTWCNLNLTPWITFACTHKWIIITRHCKKPVMLCKSEWALFPMNEVSNQDEKFNRAPSVSVMTAAAPTTCSLARSSWSKGWTKLWWGCVSMREAWWRSRLTSPTGSRDMVCMLLCETSSPIRTFLCHIKTDASETVGTGYKMCSSKAWGQDSVYSSAESL